MIPKIEFRYSKPYDDRFRENPLIIDKLKRLNKKYPKREEIIIYKKKIEKHWIKEEKLILKEISKIYGLLWKEKVIKCYIVGACRPFSDPLTLKVHKNYEDFRDSLIHELMHQIQNQNSNKIKNWWKYVDKNYKNENRLTKNHILLHSFLEKIYLKLFDSSRLEHDEKKCSKDKDYAKAWEIVNQEGADNIIKKFKEVCKLK